jgi:hypothetical protein
MPYHTSTVEDQIVKSYAAIVVFFCHETIMGPMLAAFASAVNANSGAAGKLDDGEAVLLGVADAVALDDGVAVSELVLERLRLGVRVLVRDFVPEALALILGTFVGLRLPAGDREGVLVELFVGWSLGSGGLVSLGVGELVLLPELVGEALLLSVANVVCTADCVAVFDAVLLRVELAEAELLRVGDVVSVWDADMVEVGLADTVASEVGLADIVAAEVGLADLVASDDGLADLVASEVGLVDIVASDEGLVDTVAAEVGLADNVSVLLAEFVPVLEGLREAVDSVDHEAVIEALALLEAVSLTEA